MNWSASFTIGRRRPAWPCATCAGSAQRSAGVRAREGHLGEDDLERGEDSLQKLTDKYIESIADASKRKEAEVLEVCDGDC